MVYFSIIMPVFNKKMLLPIAIESILHQSYANYELLLVDDGSSDGSSEICDYFGSMNNQVRVFHTENLGVSHARNVGIENATGKYLIFNDADDVLTSEALESIFFLLQNKEIDLVVTKHQQLKILQKQISELSLEQIFCGEREDHFTEINIHEDPQKVQICFEQRNMQSVWAKAYRAEIISNNNIRFDESKIVLEDILFNLSVLEFAKRIAILDTQAYIQISVRDVKYYRVRNDFMDDIEFAYQKLESWLRSRGLFEDEIYWNKMSRNYYLGLSRLVSDCAAERISELKSYEGVRRYLKECNDYSILRMFGLKRKAAIVKVGNVLNYLSHIPNRSAKMILGENRYEQLKRKVKN